MTMNILRIIQCNIPTFTKKKAVKFDQKSFTKL